MRTRRPTNKEVSALITRQHVEFLVNELLGACVVEEVLQAAYLTRSEQQSYDKRAEFHDWTDTPEGEAETDRVALLVARKVLPRLRERANQWEWYTVPVEPTES